MFKVECSDDNDVVYKDGDSIFLIEIEMSKALFDESGCVARDKILINDSGRVGHTKNYAIDCLIEDLLMLKDKE